MTEADFLLYTKFFYICLTESCERGDKSSTQIHKTWQRLASAS